MATATPSRNRFQNVYPGTPSTEKRRLKGLWHRNEWWCNCNPRKRAVERTVSKDTPNLGKRFWTCPLSKDKECGFFLWSEEARLREVGLTPSGAGGDAANAPPGATPSKVPFLTQTLLTDKGFEVLGARRQSDPGTSTPLEGEDGEPGPAPRPQQPMSSSQPESGTTTTTSSSDKGKGKGKAVADEPSDYAPLTPGPSGNAKRKYDAFEDDDFDDIGSDEERQLADMTDRSVEKFIREHAYDYSNQNEEGGEDDNLAGSSRPVARTLFPQAQSAKRQKAVSFEEPEPFPAAAGGRAARANGSPPPPTSTLQTSPPSTMDDSAAAAAAASSSSAATKQDDEEDKDGSGGDITEQVMGLLQTQSIEPAILQSVHDLLLMSARRTKGIAMGRDSARTAVNEKKMKIARLQERIAALEDKEQSLNGQITHIKASLMKMYEDN